MLDSVWLGCYDGFCLVGFGKEYIVRLIGLCENGNVGLVNDDMLNSVWMVREEVEVIFDEWWMRFS